MCIKNIIEMKFNYFESIISPERTHKYLIACAGDTRRAMTLYRYNLKLSQEMFTIISCFEVSLRNKIDKEMRLHFGTDRLRDMILPGGPLYYDHRVEGSRKIIEKAYNGLMREGRYTHSKLLAEMEFGVWKFMFNNVQYRLLGRHLLNIFPNKPTSSALNRYDNTYIFNELDTINKLRNRIAHHEPICFGQPVHIDVQKARECYNKMIKLLQWMGIDHRSLLYGLDHIDNVCTQILNI